MTIETKRPMPVQVDGDPIGMTPVTFEAVPRALRITVPPKVPPWLFVGGGERPQRAFAGIFRGRVARGFARGRVVWQTAW